jgi:hypothetical protein
MTFSLCCAPHPGTTSIYCCPSTRLFPRAICGGGSWSGGFWQCAAGLLDDRFLDVAELILAEEHFLADEEGRRTKCAASEAAGRSATALALSASLSCDLAFFGTNRFWTNRLRDHMGIS